MSTVNAKKPLVNGQGVCFNSPSDAVTDLLSSYKHSKIPIVSHHFPEPAVIENPGTFMCVNHI